jgi:holliday junction DNA helicase RuvB
MPQQPPTLEGYVGQAQLVSLLREEVRASKVRNTPLPSMFFSGPPGLGKTRLAHAIAASRGVAFIQMMGRTVNPNSIVNTFGKAVDDSGYAREQGEDGKPHWVLKDPAATKPSVVYITEAERAGKVWDMLHFVVEPSPAGNRFVEVAVSKNRVRKMWVPACTLIIDTNYAGEFRKKADALLSRCGIKHTFEPYDHDDLVTILAEHAASAKIRVHKEAIELIVERSIGIPRTAKHILERAYNKAIANLHKLSTTTVTVDVVEQTLKSLNIDDLGLDGKSRDYLRMLSDEPSQKLSLPTLAGRLAMDQETIRTDIEPFLMRQGLIRVETGGRALTEKGMLHIGVGSSVASRFIED